MALMRDHRSFMVALDLLPIEELTDEEVLDRHKRKRENKPQFKIDVLPDFLGGMRYIHSSPAFMGPILPMQERYIRDVELPVGAYSPLDVQVTLQHMRNLVHQERILP